MDDNDNVFVQRFTTAAILHKSFMYFNNVKKNAEKCHNSSLRQNPHVIEAISCEDEEPITYSITNETEPFLESDSHCFLPSERLPVPESWEIKPFMRDAMERFISFPHTLPSSDPFPTAWDLASAGFAYTKDHQIRCVFCNCHLNLMGLNGDLCIFRKDNLMAIHSKLNVLCPFVMGHNVENKLMPSYILSTKVVSDGKIPANLLSSSSPISSFKKIEFDPGEQLALFAQFAVDVVDYQLPVGELVDRFTQEGFVFKLNDGVSTLICFCCEMQLDPYEILQSEKKRISLYTKWCSFTETDSHFHLQNPTCAMQCEYFQQLQINITKMHEANCDQFDDETLLILSKLSLASDNTLIEGVYCASNEEG